MPLGCLLVGVGNFEDGFLSKGLGDNLQTDGQPISKAGWNGNGWQPGNIYGQGADIAQIHLERVIHLFANLEGDSRGGWGYQGIKFLKGLVKFLPD